MKSPLILLAALLGSKIVVGSCGGVGGIRALGQEVLEKASPLEEVVTADGAVVRFYEAKKGSGMLAVAAAVPKGIVNPIQWYLQNASIEGAKTKKSVEEFYEQISGKPPSGPLLEALRQQKVNEDSEGERKGWRVDDSEVAAASDESGAQAGGGGVRQLCLNCDAPFGSTQWFLNTECRAMAEYDWCRCLTHRTGNGYKIKTSDDYFQGMYVYQGAVYSKLEFRVCSDGSCRWQHLISDYVLEGWHSLIWGQGGGSWTYKGSSSFGEGDGFHVSRYDAADSDFACQVGGGLGCYVCPSID